MHITDHIPTSSTCSPWQARTYVPYVEGTVEHIGLLQFIQLRLCIYYLIVNTENRKAQVTKDWGHYRQVPSEDLSHSLHRTQQICVQQEMIDDPVTLAGKYKNWHKSELLRGEALIWQFANDALCLALAHGQQSWYTRTSCPVCMPSFKCVAKLTST